MKDLEKNIKISKLSTEFESKLNLEKIDNSSLRSIFFCQAINNHFRQNFSILLNACIENEYGQEVQKVSEQWEDRQFEHAMKECTSTFIHLIGLLQGGPSAPEWLIKFLFESQLESDQICLEPSALSIVESRGSLERTEMLKNLLEKIKQIFDLAELTDLDGVLEKIIFSSQELINDLLVFSLIEPSKNMIKHLEMYE